MIVSEPVIRMENIIKRCQSIRENLSPSSVSPVPEKVH